jgi:hypothetical protein
MTAAIRNAVMEESVDNRHIAACDAINTAVATVGARIAVIPLPSRY